MNNPYRTPNAALADVATSVSDETYEPAMFSTQGRIGRLRYLAYSCLLQLVALFFIGILAAILIPALGKNTSTSLIFPLVLVLYIPIFAIAFIMAKRRLNDLNKSGWLSLLLVVPLVNLVFALYLLFWPGSTSSNNYGPKPIPNSWGLIAAILLPLIIIGALASTAITTYQDYVKRAQQQATSQAAP